MRLHKTFLPVQVLMLSALLASGCSFSIKTLSTPGVSQPVVLETPTPPALTYTPPPSPTLAPMETPTLIPIRADTIFMLNPFESFQGGEFPRSLAFSPDGTTLAAAGGNTEDFAIYIWDIASGQMIGTLGGHRGIVWGLAFSPDGQLLASVSSDGTAQIRDWRNGDILKVLNFPGQVVSVSFSPDGQSLAVGGVDAQQNQIQNAAIWTYSVRSWEPLLKLPEFLNIVAMAYSPDGRWLVGGGTSRNVQVWRTSDGSSIYTLNHAHQVSRASISADSSTVASATCETVVNDECTEGAVWLWDLLTGRLIRKLTGIGETVEGVAFSADGSTLLTASRSGMLRFYSTSDYQTSYELTSPGGVSAVTMSTDSGLLATSNVNGEIQLWKVVYAP